MLSLGAAPRLPLFLLLFFLFLLFLLSLFCLQCIYVGEYYSCQSSSFCSDIVHNQYCGLCVRVCQTHTGILSCFCIQGHSLLKPLMVLFSDVVFDKYFFRLLQDRSVVLLWYCKLFIAWFYFEIEQLFISICKRTLSDTLSAFMLLIDLLIEESCSSLNVTLCNLFTALG